MDTSDITDKQIALICINILEWVPITQSSVNIVSGKILQFYQRIDKTAQFVQSVSGTVAISQNHQIAAKD